jgi:hypothetical protein
VRRLLDEPRHREGARRMAAALRAGVGRDEAADELEGAQPAPDAAQVAAGAAAAGASSAGTRTIITT